MTSRSASALSRLRGGQPDELPEELVGKVDLFVVDPPFITEEVWMLYAEAIRKLRRDGACACLQTRLSGFFLPLMTKLVFCFHLPRPLSNASSPSTTPPLFPPESSRVLASTILENAELLESELGVVPAAFQPSIPHLVYQYHFFVNYEPTALAVENPEIP